MKMFTNHRRATIIAAVVVGLIVVVGAAWTVWSVWISPSESENQEQPETASMDLMRQMKSTNGVLRDYDAKNQTMTIEDETGKEIVFRLDDNIDVTRGLSSAEIDIEDIPAGELISVSYSLGDKAIAVWWDNDVPKESTE